jgi:hypothetical protein
LKKLISLLLIINITTSLFASCEDDAYASYEAAEAAAYSAHSFAHANSNWSFWSMLESDSQLDADLASALSSLTVHLAICAQGNAIIKHPTL